MVRYIVLALGVALVSTNSAYCKKNKGGGTLRILSAVLRVQRLRSHAFA